MDSWGWRGWSMSANGILTREHMSGVTIRIDIADGPHLTQVVYSPDGSIWSQGWMDLSYPMDQIKRVMMSRADECIRFTVRVQGPLCEGCTAYGRTLTGFDCLDDIYGVYHVPRHRAMVTSYLD